jgi:PAS domain S-box-containing protein
LINSSAGFYRSSPEGRLIDANEALQRILGYQSRDKMMTTDMASCYEHPADRERFKSKVEKDGKIVQADGCWRREDMSLVYVRESAWVVRDLAGNVLYYEGVVEDLTDSYTKEIKIRNLEEQLETERSEKQAYLESLEKAQRKAFELVDKSPVSIAAVKSDGTFRFANDSMCKLIQLSKSEICEKNIRDFVSDEDNEFIERMLSGESYKRDDQSSCDQIRLVSTDGEITTAEIVFDLADSTNEKLIKLFIWKSYSKMYDPDREHLISELRHALDESRRIGELLPICANCKSIRVSDGSWMGIEQFIDSRSNTQFSHGICPDCAQKLYPDFYEAEK